MPAIEGLEIPRIESRKAPVREPIPSQDLIKLEAQKPQLNVLKKTFGYIHASLEGLKDNWISQHAREALLAGTILFMAATTACAGENRPGSPNIRIEPYTPTEPVASATIPAQPSQEATREAIVTVTPTETRLAPISSQEASPTDTVTTTATREPTTRPAEPTPTPRASTPEPATATRPASPTPVEALKPKQQTYWKISVDPSIEATKSQFGRTTEQDIAIIQSIVDKFPKVGKVTIKLTAGQANQFDARTQEVRIGRDYFSTDVMKFTIAHELTHYLDPVGNSEGLSVYFNGQQMNQLRFLREQALADPFWGRDYPKLETMFTPAKPKVAVSLPQGYTKEQLAAHTSKYADGVIAGQKRIGEKEKIQVFEPYFAKEYAQIETWARESENDRRLRQPYETFKELPDIKPKLNQLKAQNPRFTNVLNFVDQDALLKAENTSWLSLTEVDVELNGWRSIPTLIHLKLMSEFEKGNTIGFTQTEVTQISIQTRVLKGLADREKIGDLGAATFTTGQETSISPLLKQYQQYSVAR